MTTFTFELRSSSGEIPYHIVTPSWLKVELDNGEDGSIGSVTTAPVRVHLRVSAGHLDPGVYAGIVAFINKDTGRGTQTRTAKLSIVPLASMTLLPPLPEQAISALSSAGANSSTADGRTVVGWNGRRGAPRLQTAIRWVENKPSSLGVTGQNAEALASNGDGSTVIGFAGAQICRGFRWRADSSSVVWLPPIEGDRCSQARSIDSLGGFIVGASILWIGQRL